MTEQQPTDPAHTQQQYRWTVHGARTVHDGHPWLRVDMAEVTAPNGEHLQHARVHIPDAAIALVVDEQHRQVLTLRRHRWVIDRDGLELFGGLVEPGEDPAETARREILEESGYRPRGPGEHLITIEPMPGLVDSRMSIYLWRRGAEQVGQPCDPHETGIISWVPLADIPRLAADRQLLGAGTALGLFHYLAAAGGGT